jgi:hypothetical protein
MGQLFQRRHCRQGISRARRLDGRAVVSVVALRTQGQATQGGDHPISHLCGYFGRVRLGRLGHDDVSWVKGRVRERYTEFCMPYSMSGEWRRSDGEPAMHPKRKGWQQLRSAYSNCAHLEPI